MKNLGIITHNFPQSTNDRQNAGIFVYDIAYELAKKNKVSIFCPGEGKRKAKFGNILVDNFPVLKGKKLGDLKLCNPVDIVRSVVFFVMGLFFTPWFIKLHKIQFNVVMWAFPSGIFAYFAKRIFNTPYVVWCLGSDIYVYGKIPIIRNIVKIVLKQADVVYADGIDLADKTTTLSGVKCIFLPSASRAVFVKNKKIVKEKEKISIGFIARMEKVKGPDLLIDALGSIKDDISKFRVHLIGGGSLLEDLKKKSQALGLEKNTTFYGNIYDFQKISGVLQKCDWLIIPSRSDSIPLVFSEAMKCGTPVIVSDLPDLEYLINHYKVGLVFKKGNYKSLAKIIINLDKLSNQRKKFHLNTQKAVLDFSVERSAEKLLAYINKQ